MGFTKDTYQITVERLTGDGQGGYWWIDFDQNNRTRQIGYNESGVQETASRLAGRDTFRELIGAMVQARISLPVKPLAVNLDSVAERNNLQAQFQDPQLTDVHCATIAATFDVVNFLAYFGVFPLVARFYRLSLITLAQLGDVLISLGQQTKLTRDRAENVLDTLLSENAITNTQRGNFLRRWDNEVTGI